MIPKLSPRLALAASKVRPGSVAADIGTDHGLLPVYLVLSGKCPRVFASDKRRGPAESALETIRAYGAEDRVALAVADGLSWLGPGEVDDIVIAGLGAETICGIISDAPWVRDGGCRLILQPMTRAPLLRAFLYDLGFYISDEELCLDGGRIYSVICAQAGRSPKPASEMLLVGHRLVEKRDPLLPSHLDRLIDRQRRKVAGLCRSARAAGAGAEEELLDRLLKLRGDLYG